MAKPIHQQLAEARAKAGLRQVDIAAAIGVQPAAVSLIESGQRNTTTDRLERWAEACGAQVSVSASPSESLTALFTALEPLDARLLLDLARVLPELSEEQKETLAAIIDVWMRAKVARL